MHIKLNMYIQKATFTPHKWDMFGFFILKPHKRLIQAILQVDFDLTEKKQLTNFQK